MIKEHIIKKQKTAKLKIVNIASDIFSELGFKKATMDDIAHAVGMGKSSIYYYFRSKEEIFEAVVKNEGRQISKELEKKVLNSDKSPEEKIRQYIFIRMKSLKEMVNFYEALKNDYLGNLAFTERIRRKFDQDEKQTIKDILEEGINQGKFKLTKPKLASVVLVTFLKGLEKSMIIDQEWDMKELETNLDDILNILFYGMMK